MAQIILLTTAWGPKLGGVNSFNTDFAKALSLVLAPHTRVTCVVMHATAEEVEDAAKVGVQLLQLGLGGSERLDESQALNVLEAVRQASADEVLWWVGHDVISAWMLEVARDLIRLAGPLADPSAHASVYEAVRNAEA